MWWFVAWCVTRVVYLDVVWDTPDWAQAHPNERASICAMLILPVVGDFIALLTVLNWFNEMDSFRDR
jgi:hypothetical protein